MRKDLFTQQATFLDYTSKFRTAISEMFDKTVENSQSHLSEMTSKLSAHATSLQTSFIDKAEDYAASFQQMSYDVIDEIQRVASQTNTTPLTLPVNTKDTTDIRSPTAEPSFTPPAEITPITRLAHQPSTTTATIEPDPKPFKAATRWSNVDPAFIQKMESLTPGKSSIKGYSAFSDNQGKSYPGEQQLPPLLYDMVMKRTSVQYAGQSDILVFYNQLMNGVNPYGVFLKKIIDIKIDETLCPDSWEGIEISNHRYLQMASCLYAKLSHQSTSSHWNSSMQGISSTASLK